MGRSCTIPSRRLRAVVVSYSFGSCKDAHHQANVGGSATLNDPRDCPRDMTALTKSQHTDHPSGTVGKQGTFRA